VRQPRPGDLRPHGGAGGRACRSRRSDKRQLRRIDAATEDRIVELRKSLTDLGVDAGPHSIHHHLGSAAPSTSTIWRVLKRRGFVTRQPQKKPRSAWLRFESELPNETWRADIIEWTLADGTRVEILDFMVDRLMNRLPRRAMSPRTSKPLIASAQAPDLPAELDGVGIEAIGDGALDMVHVNGESQAARTDTLEASECVIERVVFTGTDFRVFDVGDVVFRNCDLSAVTLPERSRLHRVRFEGCRGSGMNMSGIAMSEVEFVDGRYDLATFRMSKLDRVFFTSLQAPEIDFYSATLNNCGLLNCELRGMSIEQASLDRVALFGSTLDDLRGADRLSGAYVAPDQLISLAQILANSLGIGVVDARVATQTLATATREIV
jgi:hypothetical protein